MKNFKYYIIGLAFLTACDKKLDLVNPNGPTAASYWKTEDQAFAAITGVYNALITDGTYQRSFPGLTDSRGDDFRGDSPWPDLEQAGKFIIPNNSAPVQWIWRDLYMIVYRANQVIANVGAMDASVIDETSKSRIMGQAYFLRGLAYYNLATTYKEVPLITTPPKDQNDYFPSTATEDAIWNQIFSDFGTAANMLPVSYDTVDGPDRGQKGRATKGAATGMLGKSYLYRKDWQKAANEFAKFFVAPLQGAYSLMPNYRDNFRDVGENNAESLFEVQFSASGGSVPNWTGEPTANWRQFSAVSITYGMDGKGFSDYLPTRWIYDEFKLEKTVDNKSDPRLLATIASFEPADNSTMAYGTNWPHPLDRIYPRKYTYDGLGVPFETFEGGGINYRIIRYADVLLMYAEALNELNRTAEAYPLIQTVRNRAKLPNLATVKPGMNRDQMREQIFHERALEFSIEGQRINDIIRWGWLYNPTKLAMLKARDTDFNTWTPGNEYLPIPESELAANKNLSRNPAN
ncbi:SusD family protein [Pedobacter glucosidilyticus]|nr:RagB/SusD family nutrient uptake outer membrane protein [Pedobacter glucosidilyticus]KHJ39291.1 SusD family protein [Pedobacter glucosidilyticus]